MLSSVLRSPRAIRVNIEIMRTVVQWRRMLASNVELACILAALERKYDAQFKVVFEAIRELMAADEPPKRQPIGFAPWGGSGGCHPKVPPPGMSPKLEGMLKY
jgi:hypothetical protein